MTIAYGSLGKMVATIRKQLRLTQQEVADRAKISRNWVSRIERDKAPNLTLRTLCQLASALETNPVQLFLWWPIISSMLHREGRAIEGQHVTPEKADNKLSIYGAGALCASGAWIFPMMLIVDKADGSSFGKVFLWLYLVSVATLGSWFSVGVLLSVILLNVLPEIL